jgi:hypothetical protein
MPLCPLCQGEYREGFTRCESCGADLVDRLAQPEWQGLRRLEELLASGTAALSAARGMEDAQRDQELLHEAHIPCLLYANPGSVGKNGAPQLYHLAFLPEDVEPARLTLERRRKQMIEREGLQASDAVVDLEAAELTCPACGFKFPKAEECPDCGLYLGAPAPEATPENRES